MATGHGPAWDRPVRRATGPLPALPSSRGAEFGCDDPALQQLWSIGAATLDACSTDAFMDCPGRE